MRPVIQSLMVGSVPDGHSQYAGACGTKKKIQVDWILLLALSVSLVYFQEVPYFLLGEVEP